MTAYTVNATLVCPLFLGSPSVAAVELYIGEHGPDPQQVSQANVLSTTGVVNPNLTLVASTADVRPSATIVLTGTVRMATSPEFVTVLLAKQVLASNQSIWYIWSHSVHAIPRLETNNTLTPNDNTSGPISATLPELGELGGDQPGNNSNTDNTVGALPEPDGDTGDNDYQSLTPLPRPFACTSFTLREACPPATCTWTGQMCKEYGAACDQGFALGAGGVCVVETASPGVGGGTTKLTAGSPCILGTTCKNCESGSTFWWTKGGHACGSEETLDDGTPCLEGTTCKVCRSPATQWSDGYKCGTETKSSADGTPCAAGTTCLKCINPSSIWSNGRVQCGTERLDDGMICIKDSTCRNCKSGSSTYWWTKAADACGAEEKLVNGQTCAAGTTCNACASPATFWMSKGSMMCGTEPGLDDGQLCDEATTCKRCTSKKATRWSDGFKCGEEARTLEDGTTCAKGTTCLKCKSGKSTYWWAKSADACGDEQKLADGQTCAAGTTCNACTNTSTLWSDGLHKCGRETKTSVDGTPCAVGTTCLKCINPSSMWSNGLVRCGTEPKSAEGASCGACQAGLLCCSGKCVKEARASAGAIAQCPADCRGAVTWPLGTCGRTWNTNITSRCEKCKWNDRSTGACAGCLDESTAQKTDTNGTRCLENKTTYSCPSGYSRDGVVCTKRWTEKGACKKSTTSSTCKCSKGSCANGGCYDNGKFQWGVIPQYTTKTTCVEHHDLHKIDTRNASASTTCTSSVKTCPAFYNLVGDSCHHQTARTCASGYRLYMTPDAGNKCVKVGECASGWTKHAASSEHCIK